MWCKACCFSNSMDLAGFNWETWSWMTCCLLQHLRILYRTLRCYINVVLLLLFSCHACEFSGEHFASVWWRFKCICLKCEVCTWIKTHCYCSVHIVLWLLAVFSVSDYSVFTWCLLCDRVARVNSGMNRLHLVLRRSVLSGNKVDVCVASVLIGTWILTRYLPGAAAPSHLASTE